MSMPVSRKVPFRIPRFDIQQHEVDRLQVLVGEPVSKVAVGVQSRVDAHSSSAGEQLDREPVLHQRLAAAQSESA